MKTCTKCRIEKELVAFGPNKARTDGLQSHCRECRKAVNAAYYLQTKAEQNPKRYANKKGYSDQNKKMILEYLETHPCVDCGISDIRVLEFDHVRGEKVFNIASSHWERHPRRVMEEIEKCDVRCANCHRIVTSERGGWFRSLYMPR